VLESEEALIKDERAEEEAAKAQELELQAAKEKKQRRKDEELLMSAQPGNNDTVVGDDDTARPKEPLGPPSSPQAVKKAVEDSDADVETLVDKEGLKDLAETIFEDNMERDFVEHLKEDISAQESELELLSTEPDIPVEAPKGSLVLRQQLKKLIDKVEINIRESEDKCAETHDFGIIEIDHNKDGLVTTEELTMAFRTLVAKDGVEKDQKLRKVANLLDYDQDGIIKVETLNKVFTLVLEEGGTLNITGLRRVVETVAKEELADAKEQARTFKE